MLWVNLHVQQKLCISVVSAQAKLQVLSVECQAQELKVGGKAGQVQVLIVKNTVPISGRSHSLNLLFENESVSSDTVACGFEIAAPTDCLESTNGANLPFQLTHNCGQGAIDGTGTLRFPIETKIVMDQSGTHGRFYCKNKNAAVFRTIEFTNCR